MATIVHAYSSGTGAAEAVPSNTTALLIEVLGPGQGGDGATGYPTFTAGAAGQPGGYSSKSLTLTSADWGKTFIFTVGQGGLGGQGGQGGGFGGTGGAGLPASTVMNGTDSQTVSMTANGGASGAPGTATGGTTNTTGGGSSGGAGGLVAGNGGQGSGGLVRFTYTSATNKGGRAFLTMF